MREYNWKELGRVLEGTDSTVWVMIAEDYSCTADKLSKEILSVKQVAGINGSYWGTPSYQIGDGEIIPCFVEVDENAVATAKGEQND